MITQDSPYFAQARLLVSVLPVIARERCFALKGGTAINLFVRDMPRLSVDYERQFVGMTVEPVALDQLEQARANLIAALHGRIGEQEKEFLMSFKRGNPRWELLGVEHAPDLPAVRWKLYNLAQMPPARRDAEIGNLERVLENI